MHTVVLGWFGASAAWFLPLLWRLVKSVLPGGAGLRGPGTIRLWLGFAGVFVASCALEATLINVTGVNAFGHLIAGGLAKLAGRVAAPLAMTGLLVAALPWLLDFRWHSLLAWADRSLGLGLGIRAGRRDDAPRDERRSRRAQAADATPQQHTLPANDATPRRGERWTRPTVWRPPARTRRAGIGATATAAGSTAARQMQPPYTAPAGATTSRAEPAFGAARSMAAATESGATPPLSRIAEPGGSTPAHAQTPEPAEPMSTSALTPEPIAGTPAALHTATSASGEWARTEPVAPTGWLHTATPSPDSLHAQRPKRGGTLGPHAHDNAVVRRPPTAGTADSWRVDSTRGVPPAPNVTRPPLDAASSAVAAAVVAAQHGFTTPAAGHSLPFGGAARPHGGPPPVAGSTAARAAAAAAAPATWQSKPPRPFAWPPRHPSTVIDLPAFGSATGSGGTSPAYSRPKPVDGGSASAPMSEDIAATLRTIEENAARWTTLAGVSLARRSALGKTEHMPDAVDKPKPAQAATWTHDTPPYTPDATSERRSAADAPPTESIVAKAAEASPAEPFALPGDPDAVARRTAIPQPGVDLPAAIPQVSAVSASSHEAKAVGAAETGTANEAWSTVHSDVAPPVPFDAKAAGIETLAGSRRDGRHDESLPDSTTREVADDESRHAGSVALAGDRADTSMPADTIPSGLDDGTAVNVARQQPPHDAPAVPAPAAAAMPIEAAAPMPVAGPGTIAVPLVSGAVSATPPWEATAPVHPSTSAPATIRPASAPVAASATHIHFPTTAEATLPPASSTTSTYSSAASLEAGTATPATNATVANVPEPFVREIPSSPTTPVATTGYPPPTPVATAASPLPALTVTPAPASAPTPDAPIPAPAPATGASSHAPGAVNAASPQFMPTASPGASLSPVATGFAAAPAPTITTEFARAPQAQEAPVPERSSAPVPEPLSASRSESASALAAELAPAPEPTPAPAPLSATPTLPAAAAPPPTPPGSPANSPDRPALRGHAPTTFEFRPPAASTVELPGLDLLERASSDIEPISEEKLAQTGQLIEQRLQEFKVPVAVVGASAGPVITRFEVEPALGVRGSQIVGLMKDLSRGLGLTSIRVVETIPGKTCMGLELPNARRQMIRLSEILESVPYQRSASKLTMAMGKDIVGQPVVTDLAKAPHMLVAGTTGSGKSVAINAMILSLLYKATPEEVRLIMIDPKMLELSVYEGIPHLLAPVVTDMKLAANALNWCVGEMEKRYRLMSAVGVRNLAGFNQKIRDAQAHEKKIGNPFSLTPDDPEPLSTLPMIVVVIDELADLMMVVGKKVEELIARLAQKARAAGIHLILATQRPSVDVITGLIKANIPTRVAFQVSSKIDSRTILDQMGAESLLGQGDMLFLPPGTGYPQRIHGAFVADEEVHSVVEYLKQFGEPEYVEGILDGPTTEGAPQDLFGDAPDAEADPLYDEAVAFVVRTRRASISSVQRQLRIGYNRAARLVEQMETAGLVSPMGINGSREVLAPGPAE